MTDGPKILTFDIETSPHKVWVFGTRNVNISPDQIIEPTRMICWSAKWLHEDRVRFASEYHHGTEKMLSGLWSLLDEADVTVTYNGDHFDLPHVAREFHLSLHGDPSPFVSVDLYKVIKKHEVWASHKLQWITDQLQLTGKLQHHGFRLWRECMGDFGEQDQRKAWNLMRRYSKRDTFTTEEVFVDYRHKVTNLPALSLFTDDEGDERPTCPLCGSANVTQQGYRRTKTRRYKRYQCQVDGRWFSETRSDKGVQSA